MSNIQADINKAKSSYKYRCSGAEIIIRLLERQGITCIAGIPGSCNLPMYDVLYDSSIEHILARHEQGAGFIAQGIARSTGKAAVCFATSGPGATNLLTAIADAKSDSIPLIAITGQVAASMIGTDAFQEVDIYSMTKPISKKNYLVSSAKELLQIIPEAFQVAQSGRPGPVVIDIPKDIQTAIVEFDDWPEIFSPKPCIASELSCFNEDIEKIITMINSAKKPILYIGGGIISSRSSEILRKIARKNSIPVTSTLMGLGAFPCDDPLYIGMLGMHGERHTNNIIAEADVVLAFGVRFDDRATGKVNEFCKGAQIVHIDIDRSEINKIKRADIHINADVAAVMRIIAPKIQTNNRSDWLERIRQIKACYPISNIGEQGCLKPDEIIKSLADALDDDVIITTDVGQHQMWTAQYYPFRKPGQFITSGGLGTMGFGLPVAIGVALANPDKRVVCITGDGSIMMNIQELATLYEYDLNIKIIILNNNHLGLVRQQQELFFDKRYSATKFKSSPDFVAIAAGFGVDGTTIRSGFSYAEPIKSLLNHQGPLVINMPVDSNEKVLPIVPAGASNIEMIGGNIQ